MNRFLISLIVPLALMSVASAQSGVPEPKELAGGKSQARHVEGEEAQFGSTLRTETVESSYNLLADPKAVLILGSHCGYAGQEPEGKIAVTKIASAGRFDLLEKLLSSRNNVGRAYAALELDANGRAGRYKPTAESGATMKKTLASSDSLESCIGCLFGKRKVSELSPLWANEATDIELAKKVKSEKK